MPRPVPTQSLLDHYLFDPSFALHNAARHGDTTLIKSLVASGHDANYQEPLQYGTPLHVAIACDQLPSVLTLLLSGADLEAVTPNHVRIDTGHTGDDSLRMAVRWGRREIVKVLWNLGVKGSSLNKKDARDAEGPWERRLPGLLEIAAWEGHIDVVRDLLEWRRTWTIEEINVAFVNAARIWVYDLVGTLMESHIFFQEVLREALIEALDNGPTTQFRGRPPKYDNNDYMVSRSMDEARTIELLLEAGVDVDLDELLRRVSFRPCEIETMKMLLKRGADVSAMDRNGWTPLHFACQTNLRSLHIKDANAEGIKVLIDHGADAYLVDDEGRAPIDLLKDVQGSSFAFCVKHARKPADGTLPRNEHGETVLHDLCAENRLDSMEKIKTLLDAGFNVNDPTFAGWTPLICAIRPANRELLEVTQMLWSHGADAKAATGNGCTALHRIADIARDDSEKTVVLTAELIGRGADVHAVAAVPGTMSERAMIHRAASWGHKFEEMYEDGLAKGGDSAVRMRTPLHMAAESRALPIVRILLKHGADSLAMDDMGAIPAVVAARSKTINAFWPKTEVLKVLLQAGPAGFDMADGNGFSVRDWANEEGRSENWRLWW